MNVWRTTVGIVVLGMAACQPRDLQLEAERVQKLAALRIEEESAASLLPKCESEFAACQKRMGEGHSWCSGQHAPCMAKVFEAINHAVSVRKRIEAIDVVQPPQEPLQKMPASLASFDAHMGDHYVRMTRIMGGE